MASRIETLLEEILNAVYGEEVRGSIHDAIEECYSDVSSAETLANSATNAANNAAVLANTAAAAANTATTEANDAATAANTAATNATSATTNLTAIVNSAITATTDANNARNTALTAATTANTAASDARASIDNLNTIVSNATAATTAANTAAGIANSAADDAVAATANATAATTAAVAATSNANAAISSANDAADSANAAATSANAAATSANNAAQSANSSANSASAAATSATAAANTATTKIADMDTALTDADSAIQSANTAAAAANQSSILADSSKRSCDDATYAAQTASAAANTNATRALNAATSIENMTVVGESIANTLPSYVEITDVNGHKHLHFYISKGDPGASFTIKGSAYETLADLQEDISNPSEGDIYQVGTEPPYELYRWTGVLWEDQGQITMSIDTLSNSDIDLLWAGSSLIGDTKYLEQTGLGYLIANKIKSALNNKVDVVSGKQLTTIDFTQSHVDRISTLETNVGVLANTKVTAETGRGLSTNDFTNAYKSKLDGIAVEANKTIVDNALSSSSTNPVQNAVITSAIASLESTDDILIENFASEYDSDLTYNINDVCIKDSRLYQCTTQINVPEVWNSAHWNAITVGDIVTMVSDVGSAVISDSTTSASTTWSSNKISNQLASLSSDISDLSDDFSDLSDDFGTILTDGSTSATTTWSSNKISSELTTLSDLSDLIANGQIVYGNLAAGTTTDFEISGISTYSQSFVLQDDYPTLIFAASNVNIPTMSTGEAKTIDIASSVYNIAFSQPPVTVGDRVILYKRAGTDPYILIFPFQTGAFDTLKTKVGNVALNTTAQSICGAINELLSSINTTNTTVASLKPRIVTLSVGATWSGNGPYTQTLVITGGTANTKVDLQPDATVIGQMVSDGCTALYVSNNNGIFTLYALDAPLSVASSIQATLTEVQ